MSARTNNDSCVLGVIAWCIVVAVVLPILGIVVVAASEPWAAMVQADVARYALTSAMLAACVAAGTIILGAGAAWLVAFFEFPGRALFAWLLVLPLAVPTFALAYAYADMLDVAGELRTWLRASAGVDLPVRMRSLPGAVFVLTLAFYPYVFLAAREAFRGRAAQTLEAARTLGAGPATTFFKVALPLAWPAVGAGAALAVMETLADYGAVHHLSVQSLTTGVIRAWSVYGSTASAARLAVPLIACAALIVLIERALRRSRRYVDVANRREVQTVTLKGATAIAATSTCAVLFAAAFLLPVGWMAREAASVHVEAGRVAAAASRSLGLAVASAGVVTVMAALLSIGGARRPLVSRIAGLGYAAPGAAIAIGLLVPAALLWRMAPGASASIILGVGLLMYAYSARLIAAAAEPVAAGLTRINGSVTESARVLGESALGVARRVQTPLLGGSLLTAFMIVFIDVMKELPATLILRPFNFDTLAVMADAYARDERLGQAGWCCVAIVAIATPGVIWLTARISRLHSQST